MSQLQNPSVWSPADSRQAGWWWLLAGASAVLILYLSLFPFRIRTSVDLGFLGAVENLGFKRTTRGDIVANLLLYMPIGLCLTFASSRAARRPAIVRAVLIGTALSVAVELAQAYLRFRVSSLTDVALNAAGTLAGACAAVAYGALGTSARIPVFASRHPDPAALTVVTLWLAFRLAPFVPTIDWQKYKDALKPLFIDPRIDALDFLRYLAGWLVVGYAVRLLARREYMIVAALAVVGIVLFGRLVVVGKTFDVSELAALAACGPIAWLLIALPERRVAVLAALLAVAVVAEGVTPFDLSPQAQGFGWVPFRSSFRGSAEMNYSALLEKAFWYFSLVWLLVRCGWSKVAAAVGAAGLLALIEIVQMRLPGRFADVTDPLLALVAGLLLAIPRARADERSISESSRTSRR